MIALSDNISEYLSNLFGTEFLKKYENFVSSKYPVVLRISKKVHDQNSLINNLREQGIELEEIHQVPKAFIVKKGEEQIGKTIEHLLGQYYIQSLSSMIPPLVLNPTEEDKVLDLCAAPGSKSTQLAEIMDFRGTLYANEVSLNRVKALVHNLDKMNALNMSVIKEKGEVLSKNFPNYFDKILVDAPCSALGVVQKKQEVSNWWSAKSVDKISSLQLRLLISAIKMAKVGAEIVYSTCTLTVEENEFIIDKVLKKYPVDLVDFKIDLPYVNGFCKVGDYEFDNRLDKTKRIIPWEIKSEGFFIAKLIKTGHTEKLEPVKKGRNFRKVFVQASDKRIKKYLDYLSEYFGINQNVFKNYNYLINNNDINFTSSKGIDFDSNYFIRIGTKFGIIDKNDTLKLHSHAAQILGNYADKNVFELSNEEELRKYFAGGIIHRDVDNHGQKIIIYKDYILGMGVIVNNQLKSQFPRSKRTGSISFSQS